MNSKTALHVVMALCFLLGFGCTEAPGQHKTIILVRHAEKDTSESADANDPVLSAQGIDRARRLAEKVGKYRPGAFYSTNFRRTRETVAPIAAKRRKEVQIYDAKKPQELIDRIMQSKTKRFLIVGHSNTIPGLANLIIRKEIFKNLDDAEHTVIWLIRIKDGKARKTEILDY